MRTWTAEERQILEFDNEDGIPRAETAAKLGRTEMSVIKFAERNGILYQAPSQKAEDLRKRWARKLPRLIAALRRDLEHNI
jgi:hypothetical protein